MSTTTKSPERKMFQLSRNILGNAGWSRNRSVGKFKYHSGFGPNREITLFNDEGIRLMLAREIAQSFEQQRAHHFEFGPPEVGCLRCSVAPYPLSPRVVIAFKSLFGLATVLLGREPEPEVEAVLEFTKLVNNFESPPLTHLVFEEPKLGKLGVD
ncbi:hypothetical protein Tco_1348561 [Tanacetum coccineum]